MRAHLGRDTLASAAVAIALAACAAGPQAPIGPSGGTATPAPGGVVRDYRLTAEQTSLEVKPGLRVQAWTFNGTSPGPELRATVGDVLRVTLQNRLSVGTTIHWHGLDVPNGEDGVAGLTQDAVPSGGSAIYSFRVEQTGTYWYHSHQDAAVEVDRGLYGALVVLPRGPARAELDRTLVYDEWPLGLEGLTPPAPADFSMRSYVTTTVNGRSGSAVEPIATVPGETVRLRLVNAGYQEHYVESPVPVTIVALDGHELTGGAPTGDAIPLGPGERVDILLTAPAGLFSLRLVGAFPPDREAAQPFASSGGGAVLPEPASHHLLDLLAYPGVAADDPWPGDAGPDKTFTLTLSEAAGGGSPMGPMPGMSGMDGVRYQVDGGTFPTTPVLSVVKGDLVEITFRNQGSQEHWMHLHGHFFRVLSRDGGSLPGRLVKDTVSVAPGHSVTIAFRADNPGWWMIHCHQLLHAAGGMMALLAYQGSARLANLGGAYANSPD
ncbi:MAG TPA: multicopper oxidase family protein [Candidatus Dormibacteraeota bacterium]|jgi:FtsP/CotA-like multicopper oxidase with cupredoxin domain